MADDPTPPDASRGHPDRGDVDLVLRLYELRRETEMRKARKFILEFDPKTIADVKAVVSWEHPENAHFRQVMSYWGMVADFASRGLLHPEMFAAHCGEALFIWSKFEPLLPQIRAEINPLFLTNVEAAIRSHPAVAKRVEQIREMRARQAASMKQPAAAKQAAPARQAAAKATAPAKGPSPKKKASRRR